MSHVETVGSLGRGVGGGAPMSTPLFFVRVLTEHWQFDIMHRRAGRDARPYHGDRKRFKHGDAHKYCESLSCGFARRPSTAKGWTQSIRSSKITAWRKAKARANRAYLEEFVYAKAEKRLA